MIRKNSRIYVAGHKGLIGSAIVRNLILNGYKNIITINRNKLDLTNQEKVLKFLKKKKPHFIFIAAAKVGGIYANSKYKAEYIYNNLSIQTNIIHSAYLNGVKNLIFLGSSCVYPRMCKLPIKDILIKQTTNFLKNIASTHSFSLASREGYLIVASPPYVNSL